MGERLPKFYSLLTRSHLKDAPNSLVFSSLVQPSFDPATTLAQGAFQAFVLLPQRKTGVFRFRFRAN